MLKDLKHLVCDFIKYISNGQKAFGVKNSYNKNCHSLKKERVFFPSDVQGFIPNELLLGLQVILTKLVYKVLVKLFIKHL